ncbi:M20 family dipeptidase [Candidatus Roizmanbacteria bacterium]|nr:M20 family dipeptidase [Candidatus Roizmanbacteria bacterium]
MNKQAILKTLSDFVAIQSVSTKPAHWPEMMRAVSFLGDKFTSLGFEVEVIKSKTEKAPPLLVASRIISPSVKTLGIYGHYDVQPEDPLSEWNSGPYSLTLKDGKIVGRGVADNKGHVIQNISAIENLINANQLKHNVVFLIEGEEELGSEHFEELVIQAKNRIKTADVFYINDGEMYGKNKPAIEYALRGLVSLEIELEIGKQDLHSGAYGNRAINPVLVAADLITKIKDSKTGKIVIPEFNDAVRTISEEERTLLKSIYKSDELEQEEMGTYGVVSLEKANPTLSSKIYPSFDVHGIKGGYTDPGSKNIIPRSVSFKCSFRLVENQDPQIIEKLVIDFITQNVPNGVKCTITKQGVTPPFYTSIDNGEVTKMAEIMGKVFGNKTVFTRSGGSVGAAGVLQNLFHKPVLLSGFVLPDCGMHSPNENFDEEMFWKGIEAMQQVFT